MVDIVDMVHAYFSDIGSKLLFGQSVNPLLKELFQLLGYLIHIRLRDYHALMG